MKATIVCGEHSRRMTFTEKLFQISLSPNWERAEVRVHKYFVAGASRTPAAKKSLDLLPSSLRDRYHKAALFTSHSGGLFWKTSRSVELPP